MSYGDANKAARSKRVNSGTPGNPVLLAEGRETKGVGGSVGGSGEVADLCLHFSKPVSAAISISEAEDQR